MNFKGWLNALKWRISIFKVSPDLLLLLNYIHIIYIIYEIFQVSCPLWNADIQILGGIRHLLL